VTNEVELAALALRSTYATKGALQKLKVWVLTSAVQACFEELLKDEYSPEQIVGHCKRAVKEVYRWSVCTSIFG
jgi:IS30 family transposase